MTQKQISEKVSYFIKNSYLDVNGVGPSPLSADHTQIVRLVTRMAVGASTAFWSFMELKDYMRLRKSFRKR
jgi:hypothetical protein